MKHLLSVCTLVFCFAPAAYGADEENPFKKAKTGDWAKFKMTTGVMGMNIDGELKMVVSAKTDKEATVKSTVTINGMELPGGEQKIDLTKPYDPTSTANLPKGTDVKIEKLGEGKEKIKVGGKEYDCTWMKIKSSAKIGEMNFDSEIKVWMSKDVPLGGMVKMEMKSNLANATMELKETGSK